MEPTTLTELVFRAFDRFRRANHFSFKREGRWQALATHEVKARVLDLAGALVRAGIRPGDRVAIVSPTRVECTLADYAILAIRAVVVPVYSTLSAPQMAYILKHSAARLGFVGGPDEWAKIASVKGELTNLERVVAFDPVGDPGVTGFEDFLRQSGPVPPDRPSPDDLASIIYTSGTTGEPKGVQLTHRNITANVLACTENLRFTEGDVQLSFLPLSHIYERMLSYYMAWNGVTVYFAEDIGKIKENLLEVRPTLLISVPRILEKVLTAVEDEARGGGVRGRLVRSSIDAARAWARAAWGPERDVPLLLSLKHSIHDWLVYGKVRDRFGGRLRMVITGGAATPDAVTEFFIGAGIQVLPGYGLTETSPVVAFNTPTAFRFGTVGKPLPGIEVRIAPDGEILIRGPIVMRGYYQAPEATAAVLDADGWLATGDVGHLDRHGFLAVTDRKKDLIATAGGKKIAPQPIEQALARDPLVAQAVLLGEGKPYIVALIVPRMAALETWARGRGLPCADKAALLGHPEVLALYRERIDAASKDLSRFESIKRFALLERDFTEATGEMTPTLKVKRRVVMERHRERIESLYS